MNIPQKNKKMNNQPPENNMPQEPLCTDCTKLMNI